MKRKIALLIIAGLFTYFVLENLTSGKTLIETLLKAKWEFILLCVVFQSLHYFFLGNIYKRAFSLYEVNWSVKELIPLNLAALSINVFTLLSPIPGSTIFIRKARKEGIPALNITTSIFLVVLFEYLALIPLLTGSLIFLITNSNVFNLEILAVLFFLLITGALAFLLIFGVISPSILNWIFKAIEALINNISNLFRKRRFFIKGWAESRVLSFIKLSQKLLSEKNKQFNLFLFCLTNHFVDMATLFFLFAAFGHIIPIATLVTGYSLMILFWIVTPTPQGIGVVETLTPAIFSTMGVNIEIATLAILGFRAFNLWLPVTLGYYFLHKV